MQKKTIPFYRFVFNLYSKIAFLFSTLQVNNERQKDNQKRCEMLILTVAFNNEHLIEKQIEQVRLMIKDPNYRYVVFDNSLKRKKRKAIKAVCMQYNIEYIQIPYLITVLFQYQVAISHGAALNWIYYNYLRVMQPLRFSIIDHDIFPVRKYDMTLALGNKDFYGVSRVFDGEWYLWPGFCIFSYDDFTTKPDFLPRYTKKNFLDTGGGIYKHYYCNYPLKDVVFPVVKNIRIKKSKELVRWCDIYHNDYVQIIDDAWLHLINGSNYAKIEGKDDFIKKTLADIGSFYNEIS